MRSAAVAVALAITGAAVLAVAWADTNGGDDPAASSSRERAAQSSSPRLIFREDFAGSRLDRKRWNTCHWWADRGCTIASNDELEWYLPGQVRVERGNLSLVAAKRPTTAPDGTRFPYRSGMISSGPSYGSRTPKFAFRYGRAEMRARVPRGKGMWTSFWLLPADRGTKPEIDVMEILGHRPATVEMHLHYRRGGKVRQRGNEWTHPEVRRGWHTFAIDWRPGKLAWLVDGVVRWRVTGAAVPKERMYLVANLAVGGEWPGAPNEETPFPSALTIDYVKVWR